MLFRSRLREAIPLCVGIGELAQDLLLAPRLHAGGRDVDAQRLCEGQDGPERAGVPVPPGVPIVPVGSVKLGVDPGRLGDSLRVLRIAPSAELTLAAGDTAVLIIGLTYPRVPLDSVAAVPLGRKVLVSGIALNGLSVSTPRELHLRGAGVALRTTDLDRQTIGVGDSVRVLGRRADLVGQPILNSARVFLAQSAVDVPQPVTLTTAEAASEIGRAHV